MAASERARLNPAASVMSRGPSRYERVARDLLDRAFAHERRQQPRGRGLGQAGPIGDLGHAERAVAERTEHGEGSSDGLDAGHGPFVG